MIFNGKNGTAAVMERICLLRARLNNIRKKRSLNTILVTSALPKEGKTTVAANLALSLAREMGRGAVLVDADLRNPSLDKLLGVEKGPGLTDLILGRAELKEVVVPTNEGRLRLLRGGAEVEESPGELLSSEAMSRFIRGTREYFPRDLVVIDSPPLHGIADCWPLTKDVDGIVLIIRAGMTPRDLVVRVISELDREKIVGVVLNQVRIERRKVGRHYYENY